MNNIPAQTPTVEHSQQQQYKDLIAFNIQSNNYNSSSCWKKILYRPLPLYFDLKATIENSDDLTYVHGVQCNTQLPCKSEQ